MEILSLIIFLSAMLHCKGHEVDNFTTVFSTQGKVFIAQSDRIQEAVEVKDFGRDVTGFAIHKNYLFISVKSINNGSACMGSEIWRSYINPNSMKVNRKTWALLGETNDCTYSVESMVVINSYLYAGLSNGNLWRCTHIKKLGCEIFNKFEEHGVATVDHSPKDDKIYAALTVGNLRLCSPYDAVDACEIVDFHVEKIIAMKIKLNALWLYVLKKQGEKEKYQMLKCPIPISSSSFNDIDDCKLLQEYCSCDAFTAGSVDAVNGYLYFNFLGGDKIYRCDPLHKPYCKTSVSIPNDQTVDKFIIV